MAAKNRYLERATMDRLLEHQRFINMMETAASIDRRRMNLYLKRSHKRGKGKGWIAMKDYLEPPLPTCSRCLQPLRGGFRPKTLNAIRGTVTEWERTWECPDHCASVAERWKLACERAAEGWPTYIHKCSRCGTELMGTPLVGLEERPRKFWCPGCSDLETAHGARA